MLNRWFVVIVVVVVGEKIIIGRNQFCGKEERKKKAGKIYSDAEQLKIC